MNFYDKVPGWLNPKSLKLILALDKLLSDNSVEGDILEIGVFSGRSSLLFLILNENTNAEFYFCDKFPPPMLRLFNLYIEYFVSKNLKVNILAKLSNQLKESDLSYKNKMIHIDGSHDYEPIYKDLEFCSNRLVEKGVLMLDDFIHPGYPDVNFAVTQFLRSNNHLCPFLYAFGKLFCCRAEDKDWFDSQIDNLISFELLSKMKLKKKESKLLDYKFNRLIG